MMYGQMTAGSWIYIGTQGILQGTYETFAEAGRQHFRRHARRPALRHRRLRRHGRRPAPRRHAGRRHLPHRRRRQDAPQRRVNDRYLDEIAPTSTTPPSTARSRCRRQPGPQRRRRGNAIDLLERLLERNITPDVLTDQTSAHDPLDRLRAGRVTTFEGRRGPAQGGPEATTSEPRSPRWNATSARWSRCRNAARRHFDYGNNIRQRALDQGVQGRVRVPRLRAGLHPPAVLPRPRAVPLGGAVGRPRRHRRDRPGVLEALPQ
jgi:urocanate hydratase